MYSLIMNFSCLDHPVLAMDLNLLTLLFMLLLLSSDIFQI